MNELKKLMTDLHIEYYAILPYSVLRETGERIRERSGITPQTAIIYLLPYYSGECVNISRYAASLDYHLAIKEIGGKIISHLTNRYPDYSFCSFGDHSPIDERHAALIGGLGIAGDNGLLINEKYGSYVFVADVLTDAPPELLGATAPVQIRACSHCGACKQACPTGILRGEGDDCLSAITQRKGELTQEEKLLMCRINTSWGCDLCQSACPHNRSPLITPVEFFHRDRITELTKQSLDSMTKEQFAQRAFSWRGRAVVERNLKILADRE